ncbi:hypothetical protein MMYC01_204673 [Madurella mycetomatis]|uniref:Uncharacterized protein n=1 Tax=Madurella mycetomatis TaxID=100816 RepID=A0A175W9P5_9PEZI|nr:hypothetical protein MMYC01_204673 [Madurella mycetomatis]
MAQSILYPPTQKLVDELLEEVKILKCHAVFASRNDLFEHVYANCCRPSSRADGRWRHVFSDFSQFYEFDHFDYSDNCRPTDNPPDGPPDYPVVALFHACPVNHFHACPVNCFHTRPVNLFHARSADCSADGPASCLPADKPATCPVSHFHLRLPNLWLSLRVQEQTVRAPSNQGPRPTF